MDISQFDKYGTGPLREKALADYLEALDGEDNGTPGGGGIPNPMTDDYSLDANSLHYEIRNASRINGEASNAFYDFGPNSAMIGVNGATNVSAEVTPDGLVINSNGQVFPVATEAYVDANAGGGGGSTLASPDGSIWGLSVNNLGAITTTKLADTGVGGTITLFAPDATEWDLTISNSGILTTTQI